MEVFSDSVCLFLFLQVLNLLEMMGLSQHQNSFTTERVNGEILLECDDTVLQHELKVKEKRVENN